MIAPESSVLRVVELDSIRKDTDFYLNLMLWLNTRESTNILIFGLIPYLSLFVVESYKYLQAVLPEYASSLSRKHASIIYSSRMRTKFFDDAKKRIDGMFELLSWISEFHNEWHVDQHNGLLAPLKRFLQKDLGVFAYDGHIIGSTHTGLLNLGCEKKELSTTNREVSEVLGSLSYSVGKELGSYIAHLNKWPEFNSPNSDAKQFVYNIRDENLRYKDEKSKKYFSSIFNGAGTEIINFSLMIFLTRVNFIEYILRNLAVGSPYTLFKLKFITLYHLSSSLGKLRDYYYQKNLFTDRSKRYFQSILKDKDLEKIKAQSKLRNILVHYKIEGLSDKILVPTASLYGMVEHFFDGRTYDEMTIILDDQIKRISLLLEEWLNWQIKPSQFSNW